MPSDFLVICGVGIRRGCYNTKRKKQFYAAINGTFGETSTTIPKGAHCTFYESNKFGFLIWRDASGKEHKHID